MTTNVGTLVISQIKPYDTADTYPTHEDVYGKGGYVVVANLAARDAITVARRKAGMEVYAQDQLRSYILNDDLVTWTTNSTSAEITAQYEAALAAAASANQSAINAEAAAEASGDVLFYDTYAAANAAVNTYPENQVVEVFVDETKGGARTRYRKEGGVLVFKLILSEKFRVVESVVALKALVGLVDGQQVNMNSYYATTPGTDGGGGTFVYRAASAVAEDGGTVFTATGMAVGRFHRVLNGYRLDAKEFGAKGDGSTHLLSSFFGSLGEAQDRYPFVTALTQELDWAAIQAMCNAFGTTTVLYTSGGQGRIPRGRYFVGDPIVIGSSSVLLEGDGEFATTINYTGVATTAAFTGGSASLYNYVTLRKMAIEVQTDGAYGVEYTKFSYSIFDLNLSLRVSNQIGYYGKGNGLGTGPYYNTFNGVIVGRNNVGVAPNQRAVVCDENTAVTGASGPNSNQFSGIRRVAGVAVAFDLIAGSANMFSQISIEAIQQHGFRFNNRAADFSGTATSGTAITLTNTGATFADITGGVLVITAGTGVGHVVTIASATATVITLDKAIPVLIDNTTVYEVYKNKCISNKIVNLRHEGTTTTSLFKNCFGGRLNSAKNIFSTGATVIWHNESEDADSVFAVNDGDLMPITFSVQNLAASTTTELSPIGGSSATAGGIRIPTVSRIHSVSTAVNSFTLGGTGNCTINVLRDGINDGVVTHIINDNDRFGFVKVAPTVGGSSLKNRNIRVTAVTDGSWNQTTADISVTVWVSK